MALDPIAATGGQTQSTGFGNVQDFLKILLAQLTYQDPLKPVDNQQFMAQLAQFSALEQTQQINTKLDSLLGTQSALQSVGLLGRTVEVSAAAGGFSGTVSGVSLADGIPVLTLTTSPGVTQPGVKLSQVVAVR